MPTLSMSKSERQVLRSVVRSRFKVLRAQVAEREAAMLADINTRIAERYADREAEVRKFNAEVEKIVTSAQRRIDFLREQYKKDFDEQGWWGSLRLSIPRVQRSDYEERSAMRKALEAGLKAKVREARLDLDRREAELLAEITVDDVHSDAAKAFLEKIPTPTDALPSSRLDELEANYDKEDDHR